MKGKYIGNSTISLEKGTIYEIIDINQNMCRVIDEDGVDEKEELQEYLYPKMLFEIIN